MIVLIENICSQIGFLCLCSDYILERICSLGIWVLGSRCCLPSPSSKVIMWPTASYRFRAHSLQLEFKYVYIHITPVNGAQAKQFGGNAFRLGGEDINTVVSHEITTFFSFFSSCSVLAHMASHRWMFYSWGKYIYVDWYIRSKKQLILQYTATYGLLTPLNWLMANAA